jgi:hypothetical protein
MLRHIFGDLHALLKIAALLPADLICMLCR